MREFVSFGQSCQARHFLNKHKFPSRHNVYLGEGDPFEYILSWRLSAVADLLLERFHSYFLHVKSKGPHPLGGHELIYDTANDLTSVHDVPLGMTIEEGVKRLRRRELLEGFMDFIETYPDPVFVRVNNSNETIASTVRFYDVLLKIRRSKPFKLLVFQNHEQMRVNWGLPYLDTYYDKDWQWSEEKQWTGDEALWLKILGSYRRRRDLLL